MRARVLVLSLAIGGCRQTEGTLAPPAPAAVVSAAPGGSVSILAPAAASAAGPAASAQGSPLARLHAATEEDYARFTEKLGAAHEALRRDVLASAPELAPRLTPEPPRPVAYGHGILPAITADATDVKAAPRAVSRVYSWPWTRQKIALQVTKLGDLERGMEDARKLEGGARAAALARLVDAYHAIEESQKEVDAHLKYNRFWQDTIAADRPRFDRLTRLHDDVVERQRLLDLLATAEDPELRRKEAELAAHIHDAVYGGTTPPGFVKAFHPRPDLTILRLPVYTDIEDAAYLARAKQIAEARWQVSDAAGEVRLEIDLRRVTLASLYPTGGAPRPGEHLDVPAHVARFPADGGVLTTGVDSTYAMPGRSIALGPQAMFENALAHEFGHLLGFVDAYFRGYRDRGDKGFDVIEIIPDPTDILCAPNDGRVQRQHFDLLLQAIEKRK